MNKKIIWTSLFIIIFICPAFAKASAGEAPASNYAPNLWFSKGETYYPADILNFYFDQQGNEVSGYEALEKYNNLSIEEKLDASAVYYHIEDEPDQWVYQYWLFYVFNDNPVNVQNRHFGDWEAVFVFVDKNTGEVAKAAGTAHQREIFDTEIIEPGVNHIWTYIGEGSHANCVENIADSYCNFIRWRMTEKWNEDGYKIEHSEYDLIPIDQEFVDKFRGLATLQESDALGMSILDIFNVKIQGKTVYIPLGGNPPAYAWEQEYFESPGKIKPFINYRRALDKINQKKEIVYGQLSEYLIGLSNIFNNPETFVAGLSGKFDQDEADTSPPSQINDLSAVTGTGNGWVNLSWSAPADDGEIGRASQYLIRYFTSAIDASNWHLATEVPNSIAPAEAGSMENFSVFGLASGADYYFAVRSKDESDNLSAISNSPQARASAYAGHIVISEVQAGEYEFVELYNPTGNDIDMSDWYWSSYLPSSDWNEPDVNEKFPDEAIIPAYGHYLIGLCGPSEGVWLGADWQVDSMCRLNDLAGSVAVFPYDPSEISAEWAVEDRIDALGWGNALYVYEGLSAMETELEMSLMRQPYNWDSEHNYNDFVLNNTPSPANSLGQFLWDLQDPDPFPTPPDPDPTSF